MWEKPPPLTLEALKLAGPLDWSWPGPYATITMSWARQLSKGLTLPVEGRLLSHQTEDPQATHAGKD